MHGDFYAEEPIATFAWPLLLQASGLVKIEGNGDEGEIKGRIEQIKGQRARNVLTAVKPRRQTVAVALADCRPGECIDVDALLTAMRLDDLSPTIARGEGSVEVPVTTVPVSP